MANPEPTLRGLLAFIMNVPSIDGTLVEKYLKMAVSEASPQIYKPRSGKVNCNFDKFNRAQLDSFVEYSYQYLRMFGYYDLFP